MDKKEHILFWTGVTLTGGIVGYTVGTGVQKFFDEKISPKLAKKNVSFEKREIIETVAAFGATIVSSYTIGYLIGIPYQHILQSK